MRTVQSKLLLLFIVMTLLPVSAMGTYAYRISVKAAQENAGLSMQASLEQMSKNLDYQMNQYKKYMDVIVASKDIQTYLFQKSFDPTKVETMVANLNLDNIMNSLFYLDETTGPIALYKDNHLVYSFKNAEDHVLKNLGQSEMYQSDMMKEGSIQLHTMNIKNSESGTQHDYYVFGRRLYDFSYQINEGHNAGIYLFVEEKNISDIFRDVTVNEEGTVMFINGSGKILSHTNKEKMGGLLSDEGISNIPADRVTGSFTANIKGQKMIIGYYKLSKWDMQVVQMVPQAVFTENIRSITNSMVLFSCLAFIVLLFVSWMLARRLSKPVRTMVGAMKQMQSGNFDVRIDKKFDYEYNILSGSFNYMVIQVKDLVSRLVDEEKRRGEIEFQMLQYQINPHFVHNTIGSVRLYALAEGADKVAEILHALGRLFQRTLDGSSRLVRVRTEISHLKDFIRIQQMQYMTELKVNYEIGEPEMDYLIPNLLLQPLVENAIFHGFNKRIQHPELTISVRTAGEDLILSLRDNGVGMTRERIKETMGGDGTSSSRLNSIGIKNVDQRLKINYGETYGVTLDSVVGKGTEAVIRLPARKVKEEDPT
ncbi:sensor histidine kinase [Paenibacillus sp. Soil787]|uniref:cache domain-containing sensor histidine kinase n=1 Tax=Paenibacillus sp. Soil787 TaxID=1736411 RepID=UPI000703A058|nr:sensor histidine kinase [Paenibacillus sp. Soil787]KRF09948.1 hypothetical protein ASG93_19170 [Paenibacillus sp. Soil787]